MVATTFESLEFCDESDHTENDSDDSSRSCGEDDAQIYSSADDSADESSENLSRHLHFPHIL